MQTVTEKTANFIIVLNHCYRFKYSKQKVERDRTQKDRQRERKEVPHFGYKRLSSSENNFQTKPEHRHSEPSIHPSPPPKLC